MVRARFYKIFIFKLFTSYFNNGINHRANTILIIMLHYLLEFPADNTEEYNKLLRTCYFIKHDEFEIAGSENFGKWKCKVCINDVFILQKTGSGLSSL